MQCEAFCANFSVDLIYFIAVTKWEVGNRESVFKALFFIARREYFALFVSGITFRISVSLISRGLPVWVEYLIYKVMNESAINIPLPTVRDFAPVYTFGCLYFPFLVVLHNINLFIMRFWLFMTKIYSAESTQRKQNQC